MRELIAHQLGTGTPSNAAVAAAAAEALSDARVARVTTRTSTPPAMKLNIAADAIPQGPRYAPIIAISLTSPAPVARRR